MMAVIAPWTYHNYVTYNAFLPLGRGKTDLWEGSPEFYHLMKQKQNASARVWDEELNPARNGGYDPFTIEGDRYFRARAIASIRAEPGVYVWYSLQKLVFFWIGHPAADYEWPFNFGALRDYFSTGWKIAGVVATRLILFPVALAGLIVLRRRLRPLAPLLAVCGYFMLVHAVLSPLARYSDPLYPLLAVIIAAAVGERMGGSVFHRVPT